MLYFAVKYLHLIGAAVLLGTGAGIAFFQLMAHRTGFTARTLYKLLTEAGFVEVALRRGASFDLWATGYKPGRG